MNLTKLEQLINEDRQIKSVEIDIKHSIHKMDATLTDSEVKVLTLLLIENKPVSIQAIIALFGLNQIELMVRTVESLSNTEYIKVIKRSNASMYLSSKLKLDKETEHRVQDAIFPLPNLVPKEAKLASSMTKGHDVLRRKCIPLATLNILNSTAFKLDQAMVDKTEINTDLYLPSQKEQERIHNESTTKAMELMKDKEFYFDWKYDARGRFYPVGYELNPQGSSFKKACLMLV